MSTCFHVSTSLLLTRSYSLQAVRTWLHFLGILAQQSRGDQTGKPQQSPWSAFPARLARFGTIVARSDLLPALVTRGDFCVVARARLNPADGTAKGGSADRLWGVGRFMTPPEQSCVWKQSINHKSGRSGSDWVSAHLLVRRSALSFPKGALFPLFAPDWVTFLDFPRREVDLLLP